MSVVIVGGGQAGAWVAQTLRKSGFRGAITLIGEELHAPYERPPLSKGILSGQDVASIHVVDCTGLMELDIDFVCGKTVDAIDRAARKVRCTDGSEYPYAKLVLATGGRPRPLPFPVGDLPGVHMLRTLDDAQKIAAALRQDRHLLVIGGGWIGLEVAATARQKGMQVTVIEAGERLCGRSLPAEISAFLLEEHRRNGVSVMLSSAVCALNQHGNGQLAVHIGGLPAAIVADTVLVGIGLVPNTELAQAAGLAVSNGIKVDERGQTSDEDIYAAGDVTCFPSGWAGTRLRLESWANAQNQGIAVGRALAGEDARYDDIPWFWSEQYDIQLQMIGLPHPGAAQIMRGSPEERKFTLFQLTGERITAAVAVNAPRDMKQAKRLMKAGIPVRADELANRHVRLDTL